MKMRKLFFKFSMLLFVLAMSVNAAWGINLSGMTPEEAEGNAFWARLTAKPATTTNGSGKVFVVTAEDYSGDPTEGDYEAQMSDDGWSDIFLASNLIKADVQFRTFAKADDGSYFTGWSFTDGNTDLGTESSNFWVEVTPSATKAHSNIRNYNIYAAFRAIQLVSSEMVSGSQEVADDGVGNWKCTQTIKFRAETPGFWALSSVGDERHFKRPVITRKAGTTGTWAIDDAEWITMGAGQNVTFFGNYAELTVPVTFTAPNGDAGEYAATLTLETKAGVKMTVYLYARRTVAGAEAVRYNKSKVQQETGDLTDLLAHATAEDIIKLNGNYSGAVDINKNVTFDLNGYTLSNTLTVSGGNVTLAYSAFGGTISNNVSVTAGELTLTGGTITGNINVSAGATLEQNGAAITGTVTNAGTMTTTDGSITGQLESSGTLTLNGGTFTNNSGIAVNITGGTADIKRGTISGSTYGVQANVGGEVTIGKLAAITGSTKALNGNGGSLTVNNGKFSNPDNLYDGTVTFNAGYFRTAAGTTALGKQVWRNTAGAEFREGYAYFVGNQESAQASNVSVCRIAKTSYNSLEEALAYANNNPGEGVIIIMENDYTLPAGYYTLPANATLIVPMSNDQETANPVVPRDGGIETPVCFRKLIFENGVNMEVAGTIEVTCTQYGSGETMGIPGGNYGHLILKPGSHMTINNGGYLRAWGFVTGDGTKDGSGNYLSGEIDVRRGGTVHEMFQMGDWKGGDLSFTIAMEIPGMDPCWRDMAHLFPIYTYFIQNVESPVKYHPGSSLICATSVNVAGSINAYANDIKVVGKEGEPAMFLMNEMADAENTWVRKYYDAKKDQQVYEVNSGAKLGSMVINLGEVPTAMISPGSPGTLNLVLDSRKFVLPLTNNFKIHLLSGNMEFTQSTSCLPGMEVEVDKESEVAIVKNEDASIVSGALYFYDADQWSFQNSQAKGYVGNSGKFGAIVRYSATWDLGTNGATKKPNVRNISSPAAIGDAILNVHGTFRMGEDCAVYTTWSKNMETFQIDEEGTGGASVISSNEDAGTFIFDADAPTFDGLHYGIDPESGDPIITGFGPSVIVNYDHNDYSLGSQYPVQITTVMESSTYQPVFGIELCTPVKLKNGDGTFVETSTTTAGTSYCYRDGHWTTMQVAEDECFMMEIVGGQTTYYAKPQEYVAVNATWDSENKKMVGNADHTFSDKDGAGRLFILMKADCQWWEVEKVDNLYHCIHPNNDTYYYWDDSSSNPNRHKWVEKKYTITWKNYNGDIIQTVNGDGDLVDEYEVTYGTQAVYLGSNPTREPSDDYTYTFAGWTPSLGPVKSDVTYTATYTQQPRKYTVIFTEEGGAEIERQFLLLNDMPVCENTPTRTGFTLQWEPEVAAVTGDATYRATWLEEPPTEYAVTFYDYDGTTKLKPTSEEPYMVAVGTVPTPPANPAGKSATSEYTYVFDHWSPTLEEVSATSAKVYTAVYREEAREYTIFYFKEDGTTPNTAKASETLPYGATPTPPDVTKENPVTGHTYTLVWKTLDEAGGIQTVMGSASYKPTYLDVLNIYSVTLKSNPSGACTFTGAGAFDYGTNVTNVAVSYDGDEYEFLGWSDLTGDAKTASTHSAFTLTEDVTIVADFRYKGDDKVTITWKNWDGEGDNLAISKPKVNAATTYTGTTPTRTATAEKTYTFYGWSTAANGGGTIYKNGLTPKATVSETYYAYFTEEALKYTISWKNEAGTADIEVDYNQPYGTAIAYNSATPTKQATAAATYAFDGWSTSQGGDVVALPATVSCDATYYAHFAATPKTYTVTWKRDDGSLIDNTEVEFGVTPSHADPTKPATPQYTYTFTGWDRPFETVTGLTSYTASFSQTTNTYTITWLDGDGNELDTDELEYGATPSYAGATPTKSATAEYTYAFNGTWSPSIVNVTGNATYTAQFDATPVPPAGDDLEIGVNESENLNNEVVEHTNLVMTSNGVTSGQLLGAGNLTVTGEAIFKLQPASGIPARTWYAVAAPWQVDVRTGIYAGGSHLNVGIDFDIIEFDAESYATNEAGEGNQNIWRYVDENGGVMRPGKLYMIYLASAQSSIEFHKTNGGIWTTTLSLTTTGGSGDKANWNAIANPALYNADLGISVIADASQDVLQYINGGYTPTTASNMIVGAPIFVQVNSSQSTVNATVHSGAYPAPAYRAPQAQATDNRFVVEIARNGMMNDRLIVQTADEKENTYVIGKDLAKMGVGTQTAQMWISRYNTKLCKNTVEMLNDRADYPLTIYAPAAGDYTIAYASANANAEYALYLTRNGEAIWNLSEGDYVLSMEKGTSTQYGLRISAKAPQNATGVDEAVIDAQGDVRKVLINDKVYIIRGDKVYSIDGQLIR